MINNLNTPCIVSYNMGIMTGDHDIGEGNYIQKYSRFNLMRKPAASL